MSLVAVNVLVLQLLQEGGSGLREGAETAVALGEAGDEVDRGFVGAANAEGAACTG